MSLDISDTHTNFSGTNFIGANFTNTNSAGDNITGANTTGSAGIDGVFIVSSKLSGACLLGFFLTG
ncbi:hypothetical protein FJQ87_03265 [Shewanella sp. SNU WT4]|nr:hypothetical protein FJQ87_03265 [Shewanella sp. SNU WT4]